MINKIINTPWKAINNINRILVSGLVKLMFRLYGVQILKGGGFFGIPILQKHRNSEIFIGENIELRSTLRSNPLGVNHPVMICTWQEGAVLQIGDNFSMTGGSICAVEKIVIGDDVVIGANTTIIDSDFHPTDPNIRKKNSTAGRSKLVIIEDDVFIGMNCIVLKGVIIGKGSVVGAGSVVTQSVPAGVVVAGNPARIV